MTKKKSGSHGPRPRRRPGPTRPTTRAPREESPEHLALFEQLRRGLRSDHPLELLSIVSAILAVYDDPSPDPSDFPEPSDGLGVLVDSFIGTPYAETTAALTALRALVPDEVMGARISRELADRRHPMPTWLRRLAEARSDANVWFLTHVLGDGDDYLLGVTFPSGQAISALVYVDHNLGTVVKDAFVVPEALDDLVIQVGTSLDDPDQSLTRTDAAAARALVESAIARGSGLYPPLESESWPMCRPLIEWMLRLLPAGGVVPGRREWSSEDLAGVVNEFFASPFGAPIDRPDERDLLADVVRFSTTYVTGDPYRWSPVTVELLLADWFPRKIVAEASYLAKLPDLLRAFVRYCHDRQGIRASLTRETLAAIDHHEPAYQLAITSDRSSGAAVLFGGRFAAEEKDFEHLDDLSMEEIMLASLEAAVGGRQRLMQLDAAPLPDEEFGWAGVPEDIQPVVRQVLESCDACAEALLDVEHRTAMRRFLSRSAVGDPAIFRRKGSLERAAAAVAWVICSANGTTGNLYFGLSVKDLLAHFGLKGSVSQRAEPMLRANGVNRQFQVGAHYIGAPDLLTARRRAEIIEVRDRFLRRPPTR